MICNQCGAYSEANTKYCSACGAPMPAGDIIEASSLHSNEDGQPGWDLVRSPKWPKPEFTLDNTDELLAQPPPASGAAGEPYPKSPFAQEQPIYGNNPAPFSSYAEAERAKEEFESDFTKSFQSSFREKPGPDYRRGFSPEHVSPGSFGRAPERSTIQDSADYQSSVGFGRAPERSTLSDFEEDDYPEAETSFSPEKKRAPSYSPQKRSLLQKQGSVRGARRGGSSLGGSRINPLIFVIIGAIVVLGLVIFGAVKLIGSFGGFSGFFGSVFGGSPITKPATIEEGLDDNGTDCYIITVYAREGNIVTARIAGEEISGEIKKSGYKIVRIPKYRFLPDVPVEGETAELKADVKITTPDGEVIPVDVPAVTVSVPALSIEVFEPSGTPAYATRSKLSVSGRVTPSDPSLTVTIEGQELSVDENGEFSGDYTLGDTGVYTLEVEAKSNGHQITRRDVQVDYSVAEAEIELDKKTLRTPSNSNKTTVKGTLAPDSTISITAPAGVTAGTPAVDAATGAFSFDVEIDSEGSYVIDCVVTKGGTSTAGQIVVERAPVLDTYSKAAQKMDYTRMTTEPSHNASYMCPGKVVEVLQAEPFVRAKLTTDNGDIVFEYRGTAASVEAGDGRTYNVYGDYKGLDSETGLPLIYCWFIIKPR